MIVVYLGLGSNLGDRFENLECGLDGLARAGVSITAVSHVYETDPVGYINQPPFLNIVAYGETDLAPDDLLQRSRAIEIARGHREKGSGGPRHLDIDLLFFGAERHRTDTMEIPHPRISARAFVLAPLLEIYRDDGALSRTEMTAALDRIAAEQPVRRLDRKIRLP